jgi:hypothetical protein
MKRVCTGLVKLVKVIEPFVDGTPFKTPVAVLIAIADFVEVRLLPLRNLAL